MTRDHGCRYAWLALVWLWLLAPAQAQAPTQADSDSGVHMHDGFMARVSGGFGSGVTEAGGTDAVGAFEREQSGFAGTLALDVGGAPIANLIVHGRIASASIVSPDLTLDGRDFGEQERSSVSAYLLCAGVTYYLMPLNAYGTLALGFSSLRFATRSGSAQYARPGVALQADLGKEWWIASDVGMGLGLRFGYARVSQEDAQIALDANHDFFSWALLATFTWQ
jgi:hypothetical protein